MNQRQWSWARCRASLQASFQHQRKLFLLVFLWTCLCLLLFRCSSAGRERPAERSARSPVTSAQLAAAASPPPAGPELHLASSINDCHYDYPNLLDLQFNNVHWQRMSSGFEGRTNRTAPNATYYLYNAYYDDRWRGGLPSVRVLAMIDRVQPPPTHCLLWLERLRDPQSGQPVPLKTRASFVYAWYPKWGNYRDGLLQPWIVTCGLPRQHAHLVPDSVSLVEAPRPLEEVSRRRRRQVLDSSPAGPMMAMPAAYSSSSSPAPVPPAPPAPPAAPSAGRQFDCSSLGRITNNLPVFNRRPKVKGKFAVCVKGLDFPHEDVSVRLVEWLELLSLLGAGKVFLYSLNVHENISRVLHYYQQRGLVELSPLTLPGDQPNLPEYQHLFLKSKLTAKRQNELIPYNDCLYRNLHSYQYLALLDIDEIIMPLKQQHTWHELMAQVESLSLAEQNYSRASYNVRNVYFFDDLSGPLGTTSSAPEDESPGDGGDAGDGGGGDGGRQPGQQQEHGIPHYLHMMQHVYRSKNYTKPGQYVKCFHNTERVVSLHNHFPMNCFGQCTTYSIPIQLAHLQHYRKDCVGPLKQSCKSDFRVFTQRDTTIWKYRQQMIRRTTRVLNRLGLLAGPPS